MKTLFTLIFSFSILHSFAQTEINVKVENGYKKQVEKYTKNKKVQQAFSYIEQIDSETIDDLIELTEIPAPPFMEEQRGKRYAEMLTAAGADSVWIDEVGNVLALRKGKGNGRTIALDAHLDTVFPEGTDVKVTSKGDTLFAPGIGDDTKGLANVIAVLKALEKAGIETASDVVFVGSVGEEGLGDLRGMKHIFEKNNPKFDSWIAIDGGEIGRVNNQGLGSVRYKVTFKGPGGHSWGAFGLGNPHHAAALAIASFDKEAGEFTSEGPRTSYNIGRIGGGTSVNSIPFESWMEVDMRSVSPESLKKIEAMFIESMEQALSDYNKTIRRGEALTVDIEKIGDRPSGAGDAMQPLIQRAMAATEYFGVKPSLTIGSTNANIPISLGVPAITIGRGGKAGGAHSLDEWYLNDKGAEAIKFALLMVLVEAGM